MDILLQLQSARKNRTFYVKVLDIPYTSVCRFLAYADPETVLRFLPKVEEAFIDRFYLAGIIDAAFCKRQVLYTYSYSDFTGITCGLGGASSNA